MKRLWAAACAVIILFPAAAMAESYLLMAEEQGCYWCRTWNEEVAHIYPKTDEGRAAPLQRFDLHEAPPADVEFARPVRFTPTFILVTDGVEQGRIEGYPGEDFFWGLLKKLMLDAEIPLDQTG